jgi:hypothetical protein
LIATLRARGNRRTPILDMNDAAAISSRNKIMLRQHDFKCAVPFEILRGERYHGGSHVGRKNDPDGPVRRC